MFCEVERSYIEDGFNLYGLRVCVSNFNDCLDLILDRIGPDEESDDSHLTQSACTLYGLIHARYIITAHGLDAMYNKVIGMKCPFAFPYWYLFFVMIPVTNFLAFYCITPFIDTLVRGERVWYMPINTMRGTTSITS
jgi:Casein kinase II regulatory subunit